MKNFAIHICRPVVSLLRLYTVSALCFFLSPPAQAAVHKMTPHPPETATAASGDDAAIDQTLVSEEKSLIEAKKKDDAAFFKQHLASDFALVGVDGQRLEGQDAVDNLGDSDLVELTPYDVKVVALDAGTGLVTYDAIVRMAPQEDQGPQPRYQHFTSVWVAQGGQWRLKFHQSTPTHWGDW